MSIRSYFCLPTLLLGVTAALSFGYSFQPAQENITVSLDYGYASVNAICVELSNLTGIKHTVSGELGNRKLTVVCQDIQPSAFRIELAAYFSAEWHQTDDGFKLALLPKTIQQESLEKWTDLAERKAWILDVLSFLSWCDKQEQTVASSISQGVAEYSGPKLSMLTRKELQGLSSRTSLFPAGTQLKALVNVDEALLRGEQLLAYDRTAAPLATFFIAKLTGHNDLTIVDLRPSVELSTELLPFAELIRREPHTVDGSISEPVDSLGVLNDKDPVESVVLDDPGYRSRALGLSEHARYIAKRYKVPVIAEVFRAAVTQREFQVTGTLGEYLLQVRRASKGLPFSPILPSLNRGGWVELRYRDSARLRDTEVAEALLSPVESEWQRGRPLSLDQYARIASTIPANQAGFFQRENLLLRFPALPLKTHYHHLRLVASLSSTQRQTASESLTYKSLTNFQKQEFRDAFKASLSSSIIGREQVSPFLESEDAIPIALKLTSLPAPVPTEDLEIFRPPIQRNVDPAQGNPKPEMIQGGTLVQFRFLINDTPAILTALRLLTPGKLPKVGPSESLYHPLFWLPFR